MDWPTNLEDPRIVAALTHRCDQCKAAVGVLCHNHVHPGALPGRLVHFGRLP